MKVILGDITKLEVDAIVNAANTSLLGGGGVDGAIHRAAGSELYDECRLLGGCKTGDAKLTKGYKLPARFVIHAVGPVWRKGNDGEPELLAECYRKCMQIAAEQQFESLAFPCISTGIYSFPKALASEIAVKVCWEYIQNNGGSQKVIFCCFDQENYEIYERIISKYNPKKPL
ncbi:MAG: O-acetyl-ADP-ribose deacetylase [Microcoleus sp. PH2017_29_MFU_D_A]|jgi:O-acetyl-ADP-ribose deacetylase|uniref:O-acetyl-ADP-ribose deacetylase n=1 Tax=unclassified Microcoleus TaxID=2642155 RepID=UPI001D1CE420|nr:MULTISPECIES: O-acetyl-ADP-ribose deacetylase [unclassified Microcoleus]MCC3417413.1 O-acetyl-ADP-ribose deacetylase [Microcoleus sp. PH2017_07_MST_O_A]MCC3429855.1 O-acetyl-ADP-ribose deacetylase [Microcoleus sp. PH2017_04_SCI_O_A]MCC3441462.1 O-acetyl-ADP-ribose deacetylase [Microcoleus sp. PH2017_03_ELD_O_A]MCC3467029.1 O-acetyl-ADP-ribose deacetylase [Microcoleus sp. PH2017_06_SFM_O_A]MCC3505775.1 O-acetyl-ADP-ribose deacetylase [Microcoleus sp. PH2017_19_SFW_U_A]MCC3510146.1 O-acetyl-